MPNIYLHLNISVRNSEMDEENINLDEKNSSTYDKAKQYWQSVEPTLSGMLGGIYEVAYIGKIIFYSFNLVSITNFILLFRYSRIAKFSQSAIQV